MRTLRATGKAAEAQSIGERRRGQRLVFLASTAVYGVALIAVVLVVTSRTGQLTFVLDDPYIHLAIADNIADHATFGLVPGVYESASSSPAWTVTLALGLAVTPVGGTWLALAFGVCSSIWILWNLTAAPLLDRFGRLPLLVVGLALLPITVGLVPLTMTGMEHTLHAAVVLQVVLLLPAVVDRSATRSMRLAYYLLLAISGLVRFESLFVAAGCAVAIVVAMPTSKAGRWAWDRWRPALAGVSATAAPVALFAVGNAVAGQYLVPNSVAAKSTWGGDQLLPSLSTISERLGRDRLLVTLALLAVGALVFVTIKRLNGLEGALVALIIATVLHVALANIGWFDRYQAYLVVASAGVLLQVAACRQFPSSWLTGTALGLVLIALVAPRLILLTQVAGGSQNVRDQQQQVAEFFAVYYRDEAIAVNDLGYVAWLHDGPVLDIAGLGSFEVLDASKNGRADADFFERLADDHDVRAAALYHRLFGGIVPASWIPVETWCLTDELVTAADRCVTFYATPEGDAGKLAAELEEFGAGLPDSVDVVAGIP